MPGSCHENFRRDNWLGQAGHYMWKGKNKPRNLTTFFHTLLSLNCSSELNHHAVTFLKKWQNFHTFCSSMLTIAMNNVVWEFRHFFFYLKKNEYTSGHWIFFQTYINIIFVYKPLLLSLARGVKRLRARAHVFFYYIWIKHLLLISYFYNNISAVIHLWYPSLATLSLLVMV